MMPIETIDWINRTAARRFLRGHHERTPNMATLTYDIYDAFQKQELDRWNAVIAKDVLIDSPAGRGLRGLDALKGWAAEFGGGFAYRIDLVDEHLALDESGNGRG